MGIKKILAVKMGKIENDKVLTKKTCKENRLGLYRVIHELSFSPKSYVTR